MAGRSKYAETDRAKVYVNLRANDNNVKRTARETGVPENTVRRWRDEWANGLNIPEATVVRAEADNFVGQAERIRDYALATLENKIPDAKPSELITIVGVLDDKITRARGIDRDRNLHVHHHLPSPEEIRMMMGGFVQGAVRAATESDEIEDAVVLELNP